MNFREFKKTGIPSSNFLLRLEFKTEEKDAPLLSINNCAGDCDYDTHLFLKNGKVAFQVGEPPLFVCAGESSLADNKWHRLEIFCFTDQETRMMVDGKLGQGSMPQKSELMSAVGINIGYTSLMKHATLTGSVRDLVIEEYSAQGMEFPQVYSKYLEVREEIKAIKRAEEEDIGLDKQI